MGRWSRLSARSGDEPGKAARAASVRARVRVVIVDDHRLFRAGVRAELGEPRRGGRRRRHVAEAVEAIAASASPTWCCSTSTCPTAAAAR